MSTLLETARPATIPESVNGRIPTLDGWRGAAILLVLIGHFMPRTYFSLVRTIGGHGVSVFFVLSGFLITSRLLDEQERNGQINLLRFYVRRIFRLMPCAWAYLLAVWTLGTVWASGLVKPGELEACLFFFRNYVAFGPSGPTVHFWSLSIEEQFYLIWPCVLVLAGARRSKWIAVAAILILAGRRWLYWSYFASLPLQFTTRTPLHADALLIGCLAAIMAPQLRQIRLPAAPLLVAFAACIYLFRSFIPLCESAIIAALLLSTSGQTNSIVSRFLESVPMTQIGRLSFSIYIWQELPAMYWDTRYWAIALRLGIVATLTLASYYGIERPMIAVGRRCEAMLGTIRFLPNDPNGVEGGGAG